MTVPASKYPYRFTQSPWYGYAACLLLVVLWGLQPFAMKIALRQFDVYTISWARFTVAALVTIFCIRRSLPEYFTRFKKFPLTLCFCGFCLGLNYVFYMTGVELGGPLTANILIQIGPLTLALVGVFVFREVLTRIQLVAICLAAVGFIAFYSDRLSVANSGGLQGDAAVATVLAAWTWVIFCIGQKRTGPIVGTTLPNLVAYIISSLCLIVFVDWQSFQELFNISFLAVLYLSASTVVGYTALGEAIRTLPVSVVSLCIVTNPFVTIFVVEMLVLIEITYFDVVPLTRLGYIGTVCAIVGVGIATAKFSRKSQG